MRSKELKDGLRTVYRRALRGIKTRQDLPIKTEGSHYQMSAISDELLEIADKLESIKARFDASEVKGSIARLNDAAEQAGKAWSGSWLGYHSRVYYRDLQPPPSGARFSQEWGLMNTSFIQDTIGD